MTKTYECTYIPQNKEIHIYERVLTNKGDREFDFKVYAVNEKKDVMHTIDGCYFCTNPVAGTSCKKEIFQNGRLRMLLSSDTGPKFEISLNI